MELLQGSDYKPLNSLAKIQNFFNEDNGETRLEVKDEGEEEEKQSPPKEEEKIQTSKKEKSEAEELEEADDGSKNPIFIKKNSQEGLADTDRHRNLMKSQNLNQSRPGSAKITLTSKIASDLSPNLPVKIGIPPSMELRRGSSTTRAGALKKLCGWDDHLKSINLRREAWEKKNLPQMDTKEGLEINYNYLIKLLDDFISSGNLGGIRNLAKRMRKVFERSDQIEEEEIAKSLENTDDIMDLGQDVLIPFLSINMPIQYFIEVSNMDDVETTINHVDRYPFHMLRKALMIVAKIISKNCRQVVESAIFEYIILTIIFTNSIILVASDPLDNNPNSLDKTSDIYFLSIYILEMSLKVCGMGLFFNKNAYLRDPWNILDFFIVWMGILSLIFEDEYGNGIAILRVFRVLRPLRTVANIKSLRLLLSAMFSAMPLLLDTIVILIFVFSIFAIAGLQLFSGKLKQNCLEAATGIWQKLDREGQTLCGGTEVCPQGFICAKAFQNPNRDTMDFDMFFSSFLQVFQVVSLEGWTQVMEFTQRTVSYWVWVYFVSLTLIGSFFLMNLTLAIIKFKFSETEKQKYEAKNLKLVKKRDMKLFIGESYSLLKMKKQKFFEGVKRRSEGKISRKLSKKESQLLIKLFHVEGGNNYIDHILHKSNQIDQILSPTKSDQGSPTKGRNRGLFSKFLREKGQVLPFHKTDAEHETSSRANKQKNQNQELIFHSPNSDKLSVKNENFDSKSVHTHKSSTSYHSARSLPLMKRYNSFNKQLEKSSFAKGFERNIKDDNKNENDNVPFHLRTKFDEIQIALGSLSSPFNKEKNGKVGDVENREKLSLNEVDQKPKLISFGTNFFEYNPKAENNTTDINKESIGENEYQMLKTQSELGDDENEKIDKLNLITPIPLENEGPLLLPLNLIPDAELISPTISARRLITRGDYDNSPLSLQKSKFEKTKKMIMRIIEKDSPHLLIEGSSFLQSKLKLIAFVKKKLGFDKTEEKIFYTEIFSTNERLRRSFNPKYLKTIVNHSQPYNSFSFEDVLPVRKKALEEILRRKEEEDIKTSKYKIQYFMAPSEQKATKRSEDEQSFSTLSPLEAIKNNISLDRCLSTSPTKDFNDFKLKKKKIPIYMVSGRIAQTRALSNKNSTSKIRRSRSFTFSKFKDKKKRKSFIDLEFKFNELKGNLLYERLKVMINKELEFEGDDPEVRNTDEVNNEQIYNEIKKAEYKEGKLIQTVISASDVLSLDFLYYKYDINLKSIISALNSSRSAYGMWRPNLKGKLLTLRDKIEILVQSRLFDLFILLCVVVNTVIIGLEGLISDEDFQRISDLNFAFTIIFTFEMALKMCGLGLFGYLRDKINIFDCILVILTLSEAIFFDSDRNSAISAFRTVRLFRTIRVLRMTKLLRSLRYMRFIFDVFSNASQSFLYIGLLLILFIFIYTLLGMSLFATKNYDTNSDGMNSIKRINFNTFNSAFFLVFQLMTVENWNQIMISLYLSGASPAYLYIFLMSWIFIGNYILLNLLLAILLEGFSPELLNEDYNQKNVDSIPEIRVGRAIENKKTDINLPEIQETFKQSQNEIVVVQDLLEELESETNETNDENPIRLKRKASEISVMLIELDEQSLYIFGQENCLRIVCFRIVNYRIFENLILLFIAISSLNLVFETYENDDHSISKSIDYCLNAIFILEALMKIISFGFIFNKHAYLRDGWCILDFIIVIFSVTDMILIDLDFYFVKILRLLRILRPLRMVSHNKSMKVIVNAILESLGSLIHVSIVILLFKVMYAMIGVSLFRNKLGYCSSEINPYGIGYEECLRNQGTWEIHETNYENVIQGTFTNYILGTMEGWPDVAYLLIDSDTPDKGPSYENTPLNGYFVLLYILFGPLFLSNFFVGILFMHYQTSEKKEKFRYLSDDQNRWLEIQKLIVKENPDFEYFITPKHRFAKFVYKIVSTNYFETFIIFSIVANIIVMAMYFDDATDSYVSTLESLNLFFSLVFIIEAILKMVGFGLRRYLYNGWNRFDLFVVLTSIIDILLSRLIEQNDIVNYIGFFPQLVRIFRLLRLSRFLKLIKSFKGLNNLILTAYHALPSMLNAIALLFLMFFIFSIMGVSLFKTVRTGKIIGDYANFSNFGMAILTLYRCITGEDWQKIMFDTLELGNYYAFYYICFILFCENIVLNIFLLIIIREFEVNYINPDNPLQDFKVNVRLFKDIWVRFTEANLGMKIHSKKLIDFFSSLPEPLGWYSPEYDQKITKGYSAEELERYQLSKKTTISKVLMKMNLMADSEGFLYFNELLHATLKRAFGQEIYQYLTPEGLHLLDAEEKKVLTKFQMKSLRLMLKRGKNTPVEKVTLNPLWTRLFATTCLKTWKTFAGNAQPDERESDKTKYSCEEERSVASSNKRKRNESNHKRKNSHSGSPSDSDKKSEETEKNHKLIELIEIGKTMENTQTEEEQYDDTNRALKVPRKNLLHIETFGDVDFDD